MTQSVCSSAGGQESSSPTSQAKPTRAESPIAPHLTRGLKLLSLLTVLMVLIEFSGAWYWPPASDTDALPVRMLGGEFRSLLWLALLFLFLSAYAMRHTDTLQCVIACLAPILPFVLFGLVAVVWSTDRGASARNVIIWLLVFAPIAACGAWLSSSALRRLLVSFFVTITVLSLVAAAALPEIGVGYHYGDPVVKGLFIHKNSFGYFCAIGMVLLAALGMLCRRLGWIAVALMAVGAIVSGSMTAIAIGGFTTLFVLMLRAAAHRPSARVSVAVLFISVIIAGLTVLVFGREVLTTLLDRDPTFSGRTILWAHFLDAFGNNIVLGQGPGLMSSYSENSARIIRAIPGSYGNIGEPHNLYIAILGELGLAGLVFFIGAHLWIAFVGPARGSSEWAIVAAGMSLMILLRALSEDNEGFVPSLAFILVTLSRTQDLSTASLAPAPRVPPDQVGP